MLKRFSIFLTIFVLIYSSSYAQKKLIAFSSDATPNDKQGIFIMDENGDGVQQVAFSKFDCYNPVFSPDGFKIFFRSTTGAGDYLYWVDLRDTNTWRFPIFLDGGVDPVFSPDGAEIIYRSEKLGTNAIFLTILESGESFEISDGSMSFHAEFDPEGGRIVYSSSAEGTPDIVVLNLEDSTENAQKFLTKSKDAELMGTFSPDGNLIAYAAFDVNYKGTIHVMNSDGSGNRTLTKGLGSSYNPKFSPDGSNLAFVSQTGNKIELYICKTDGTALKKVSQNSGNTQEFDWSFDGKKLVYEDKLDNVSSIKVYDIIAGTTENMTGSKANNVGPAFQK